MTPTRANASRRHDTLSGVTSKGTDRRTVRMELELWDELGQAASGNKDGRSGVIRELVRLYLGKPGAQMPKRHGAEASEEQ